MHLSSNRRVRNLALYFQSTTPARKLTHRTKFEHPRRHEFWTCHVSLLPWAREMPTYPGRHEFRTHHVSSQLWAREMPKPTQKTARISATPCFFATFSQQNATNQLELTNFVPNCTHWPQPQCQGKYQFFIIVHIVWNVFINLHLHQPKTTTWEHLIAWFLNCRPIVTHSDSSTLAQDAVLNCYKKPAHNNYQFSNFFRRPTSSCVVFWWTSLYGQNSHCLDKYPSSKRLIR